ncbi:MAG: GNAT family N-acetyltransferase, partial [Gammaproteobacteria bacterium]
RLHQRSLEQNRHDAELAQRRFARVHPDNRLVADNLERAWNEALRRVAAAGARKVWLEVRESNHTAIAFYQRHGFAVFGRRRAYYQLPPEDALILGGTVERSSQSTR